MMTGCWQVRLTELAHGILRICRQANAVGKEHWARHSVQPPDSLGQPSAEEDHPVAAGGLYHQLGGMSAFKAVPLPDLD